MPGRGVEGILRDRNALLTSVWPDVARELQNGRESPSIGSDITCNLHCHSTNQAQDHCKNHCESKRPHWFSLPWV